jgi:hypothetical protein
VVRVLNRSFARGELPADQKIWRDYPATTCLEQLLAERASPSTKPLATP